MTALVGIIMGSKSDWDTMSKASDMLDKLGIPYEVQVVSAHRTPELLDQMIQEAEAVGISAILAAAGASAHLPGVIAAKTLIPVIGVPLPTSALMGFDSLLSIVQMPGGIPVATMAVGEAGARNGALFIVQMLSVDSPDLKELLQQYRQEMKEKIQSGDQGYHPGALGE